MKKFVLVIFILIATAGIVFLVSGRTYSQVEAACEEIADSESPLNSLSAWLKEEEIFNGRVDRPFDVGFLTDRYLGFDAESVEKSDYYIWFQADVRGGALSYRVAYGYFLFTAEGLLVDYDIDSTNYGM